MLIGKHDTSKHFWGLQTIWLLFLPRVVRMSPFSAISDSCLHYRPHNNHFLSGVIVFLLPPENSRKLLKSWCFAHWDNNIRQKNMLLKIYVKVSKNPKGTKYILK